MNWKDRIERAKKTGKFTNEDYDKIQELIAHLELLAWDVKINDIEQVEKIYKKIQGLEI